MLKITAIAATQLLTLPDVAWSPEGSVAPGEHLAEFAGRACYQSWNRPNPATATNEGYLRNVLAQGHMSVFEHASVTLYYEGVSRSLSHELVRHRHLAYSQLSQRYVDSSGVELVMPPEAQGDEYLEAIFEANMKRNIEDYEKVQEHLSQKYADENVIASKTELRKRARQTARAALPNDTETKIVVTGNYRAWRHFVSMRATSGADREIRAAAVETLKILQGLTRTVFSDFEIYRLEDGTYAARTELKTEV